MTLRFMGVREGRESRERKRGVYEKNERERVTCSSRDTDKHPILCNLGDLVLFYVLLLRLNSLF